MFVDLCHLTLILLIFILPTVSSRGQCDQSFSFFGSGIALSSNLTCCRKLPALSAELGWNLLTAVVDNFIFDIVFSVKPVSAAGWAAWGINSGPKAQMIGTQALVWIGGPDAAIRTYNITAKVKQGCGLTNSSVEFRVENVQWSYTLVGSGRVVMAARLRLPTADYNESKLNHVWQVGQAAAGTAPLHHPLRLENFDSAETLNLATGDGVGSNRATLRDMIALWLKPKSKDKYRKYWSVYHHFVGYLLMALAIVNIFKGFNILKPPPKWRCYYLGILSSIASAVLLLEIITWYTFCRQLKNDDNSTTRTS